MTRWFWKELLRQIEGGVRDSALSRFRLDKRTRAICALIVGTERLGARRYGAVGDEGRDCPESGADYGGKNPPSGTIRHGASLQRKMTPALPAQNCDGKLRARPAAVQIEKRREAPAPIVEPNKNGRNGVQNQNLRPAGVHVSTALLLVWSIGLPTTGLLYILGYLR